jgi:hypothetical protein
MNIMDRVIISILFSGAILRPTEPHWTYMLMVIVVFLVWQGCVELINKQYPNKVEIQGE